MQTDTASRRYRYAFVLVLTLFVAATFVTVIRAFLLDLLMAAVFAGMLEPLNRRLAKRLRGSRNLSSGAVVAIALLAITLPLVGVISLASTQATQLSEATAHWVQYVATHPTRIAHIVPDWLAPDIWVKKTIRSLTSGASDLVRSASQLVAKDFTSITERAVSVMLHFIVFFYSLFSFLQRGPTILDTVLSQLPLAKAESHAVLTKIMATANATLKSIVVIGLLQGALTGLAFRVVEIGQPLFWAVITVVASVIPSIGPKIIWMPAALILLITGHTTYAIGLALWGLMVIDMVDNVVRPIIVGRDAAIPDFLVLVSTLGGLMVFGLPGLLVGPILAAVFLALLDLYASVMRSTGLSNIAE